MWWSTFILFGLSWTSAVGLWILRRLYIDAKDTSNVARTTSTTANGDKLDEDTPLLDSPEGVKQLKRVHPHPSTPWWRLSNYLASIDEAKTERDKAIGGLYRRFIAEPDRAPSPLEEGHEGMIVAVVKLRFWLNYLSIRAMIGLTVFPILAMLLLNSHIWVPWLFLGSHWDISQASSRGVAVNMRDTALYEWHDVAGVRRAVPYCTQYDKATEIYRDETRLLLERDMLKDETPHARCILRTKPGAGHMWTMAADMSAELKALTTRRAISNVTLPGLLETEMMPPFLYVLRDGERYIRVTMRSDDDTHFQPRMVRVADLKNLLGTWQREVSQGALNSNIHYCMCPAFFGILDNMTFSLNTATNEWEIWLQPSISYVNPLSLVDAPRRMRYSKEIAPLPYHQNQQIIDAIPDTTGQNHMFRGHDTIRIQFADPMLVRLPEDLEERERFWMGHGTLKRVHEDGSPFALAVPLKRERFSSERLITGADTVCYMHCQHLLDVVLSKR